jgi:transposase
MRWAGHVAQLGEKGNVYRLLVGKTAEKRPLGRPRCRWVNNIKMDLLDVGWDGVDWIDLPQDRDKWRAIVNGNEPSGFIKCCETIKWLHNWWPLE